MSQYDRRAWLRAAGTGAVGFGVGGLATIPTTAAEPADPAPGVHQVVLGKEFQLASQSSPVEAGSSKFSIVRLGSCKLKLDDDQRLTAAVHAAVRQYTHTEYWVSLAVFDKQNTFLGAATHKLTVQYIRLGVMPTMLPELEFDFGISERFRDVTRLAVAIGDREVPEPLGF